MKFLLSHSPDLFAKKLLFARTTSFLHLSSDVHVSEEIDWSTHHMLAKRWFTDGNMRVDCWLSVKQNA